MTVENMINLRNSPFLWFALLLLIPYGIGDATDLPLSGSLIVVACLIAVSGAWMAWRRYAPGNQTWSTVAISVMVLAAGTVRMWGFDRSVFPGPPLTTSLKMNGRLEVVEVLKRREGSVSLRCKVAHLEPVDSSLLTEMTDKFILVALRQPPGDPMFPGDQIEGVGWVSPVNAPLNPKAFDLKTHYKAMAVRHRMSCKGEEVVIHTSSRFSIRRMAARWQYGLSSIVHGHLSPRVAQLTNALVWGDRSDMDQEVIDAFADSGAMHVLSVSGMHVAMIYSMLYLLLGPPGAGMLAKRIVRLLMYISAIGLYMILTGGSAAVVRAGWMIILFVTGKAMGWNTQIWNLLGFAAFVMLWINPWIWHNIGFQLSFLAMAGLLLFTRPISRVWSFRHVVLQRTWEICAVSIAAQAFILPLLLAGFHTFPLTFIASSLAATPAGYIIIFGAIINVILAVFGQHWLWPVLEFAGEACIKTMQWLATLNPEMYYAMPGGAVWCMMGMVCFFTAGLLYRWDQGKYIAMIMSIGLWCILIPHRSRQWKVQEVVIYHTFQGLLLDVFREGQCMSIRDSIVSPSNVKFAAKGWRSYRDIISTSDIPITESFVFGNVQYHPPILRGPGFNLLMLSDSTMAAISVNDITHIVVHDCADLRSARNILCDIHPAVTILPAHLNPRLRSSLIRFLQQHDMTYHDVAQAGYYRMDL